MSFRGHYAAPMGQCFYAADASGHSVSAREGRSSYAGGGEIAGLRTQAQPGLTRHAGSDEGLTTLVATIRETYRQREDLLRAEKRLVLQIKAICRRLVGGDLKEAGKLYKAVTGKGDHDSADLANIIVVHFREAHKAVHEPRKALDRQLAKMAEKLPVSGFVKATRGFSWGSLAAIVGAAGNLADYPTHSHLWKRMGLAVMEDGTRQRRTKDGAHGYDPTKRAIMWNVGECQITLGGPYRTQYDRRKSYEIGREPDIKPAIAHARAKRYIEKKLLRDLWKAWRSAV